MFEVVQLGGQVLGLIAYAAEGAWWLLGWGAWLMFAVWVPVSVVGLAIGTIMG